MYKKLLAFAGVIALSFTSSVSADVVSEVIQWNNITTINTQKKQDFSQYLRSVNWNKQYNVYYAFRWSDNTDWFHFDSWNICFITSAIGNAPTLTLELIHDNWGPFNSSMWAVSQPIWNGKAYQHKWSNIKEGSYQLKLTTDGRAANGSGTFKNC